jgi:hypothetical protein
MMMMMMIMIVSFKGSGIVYYIFGASYSFRIPAHLIFFDLQLLKPVDIIYQQNTHGAETRAFGICTELCELP